MKEGITNHLSEDALWDCIDDKSITKLYEPHLRSCESCRELLAELKSVHQELKQINSFVPSPGFSQAVVSRWKTKEVAFQWFLPIAISCFLFLFGVSIHLLSLAKVPIHSTFIQTTLFIIVLCTYLLIGLRNASEKESYT